MPTPDEADRISEEVFRQTGFPFVIGVIDGTHIELLKPKGNQNIEYLLKKPQA